MIAEPQAEAERSDAAPADEGTPHLCPLCALDFTGAECHSSCPFAKGCRMIRCPRCGFEFVEEGILVSLYRRFVPGSRRSSR